MTDKYSWINNEGSTHFTDHLKEITTNRRTNNIYLRYKNWTSPKLLSSHDQKYQTSGT